MGASNGKRSQKINNQISEKVMLKIVSDYYAKKGASKKPLYEEILQMDKESFQTWMLMRIQKPEQERMLQEMVDHEEKTGSYEKTFREDDPSFYKLFLDLFKRDKSKKTQEVLESMKWTLEKYGEKTDADVVKESMMAKCIEDYYSIGRGSKQTP